MEPSAALSTSAQIAIAIAGFAGVVAVFRNESVRDWGRVEKFWLRLLLVMGGLPHLLVWHFADRVEKSRPRWLNALRPILLGRRAGITARCNRAEILSTQVT